MATYYVAKTGSDDNAGTLAAPWLTIAYAATQLSAGDTLYIRAGTYVESVTFAVNGTAANRITIDNYQDEAVVIDGEDTIPANVYYFLVQVSGDYTMLRDITVYRSHGACVAITGDYSYAVNVTGDTCRESGIIAAGTGNIIDGCTMTKNGQGYGVEGQATWGSAIATVGTYTTIKNCTSYENVGEGFNAYSTASYSTIEDNVSYDNGLGIYLDSTDNLTIQRNLVYLSAYAQSKKGIVIGGETGEPAGLTIVNNLVYGTWVNLESDSNVETADGWTIAYNTFVNSRKSAQDISDGYNMGVYFRPQLVNFSNSVFKNNIIIEEGENQIPINTTMTNPHSGFTFSYNCWNETPTAAAQGIWDVVGDPKIAKDGTTGAGELTWRYFLLLPDSPAIGVGGSISGIMDDYLGYPRDTTPEIGALEYQDTTLVASDNYTITISDIATLAQIHQLVANEGFQICVSDQATLLAGAALVADENYQVQFSENAILTSTGQLIAYENDQFQYSDEAVLWTGDLIADENYQTQVSDNASLGATEGPTIIFNLYGPIRIICTGIQTTENAPEMPPREINKVYQE